MSRFKFLAATFISATALLTSTLSGAHAAGAGASTYTQTDHNASQVISDNPNPCTGALGTVTLTYNDVMHVTTLANGTDWMTFTQTGDFSFVPYDSTQPSYSGHFTTWGNQNDNLQNGNSTYTFSLHGTGSDGSTLSFHEVAHYSVSATGVTVVFDRPTCG